MNTQLKIIFYLGVNNETFNNPINIIDLLVYSPLFGDRILLDSIPLYGSYIRSLIERLSIRCDESYILNHFIYKFQKEYRFIFNIGIEDYEYLLDITRKINCITEERKDIVNKWEAYLQEYYLIDDIINLIDNFEKKKILINKSKEEIEKLKSLLKFQ